jgi:hypothetical protein
MKLRTVVWLGGIIAGAALRVAGCAVPATSQPDGAAASEAQAGEAAPQRDSAAAMDSAALADDHSANGGLAIDAFAPSDLGVYWGPDASGPPDGFDAAPTEADATQLDAPADTAHAPEATTPAVDATPPPDVVSLGVPTCAPVGATCATGAWCNHWWQDACGRLTVTCDCPAGVWNCRVDGINCHDPRHCLTGIDTRRVRAPVGRSSVTREQVVACGPSRGLWKTDYVFPPRARR